MSTRPLPSALYPREVDLSVLAPQADAAIGDGALGFWKAMREVFPNTRGPGSRAAGIAMGLQADRRRTSLLVGRERTLIHRS